MVEYLTFAGNHLQNLKDQLDDFSFRYSFKTTDISTHFERLHVNCDYLHVDLFVEKDIYIYQKSISSLSHPSGLLIYLFEGNQPPFFEVDEVNLKTLKQGMLIITHKQTCKIRFSKSYRGFWCVFSMSEQWCSENFPPPFPTRSNCLPLSVLSIHYMNQLRSEGFSNTKRGAYARTIILHQLFYQLLIEFIKDFQQSSNSVEQIKQYLLTNLSSPLPPLEELAQLCNMSVSTFKSKFQQNTGGSAKKFFYDAQMNLATRLLSQGFTIKEIANQLGYANASNFIHAFKRKFGVSPLKHKDVNALTD